MVRYPQILLTWYIWLPTGIPGLTFDLHTPSHLHNTPAKKFVNPVALLQPTSEQSSSITTPL